METFSPDVSFKRSLIGPRQASWNALLERLDSVHLTQGPDEFKGNPNDSGKFMVDSMYNSLIQPDVPVNNKKKIWKMKITLKTKVFAWYLHLGLNLTKDNLAKLNW